MSKKLIFVDVETTGLYADTDELVELTYAYEFEYGHKIKTLYFGVEEVPEFIDNLINFTKRGIAGRKSSTEEIDEFMELTDGQTMVSANPPFDRGFLDKNDLYVFHHRNLDIETYAMAKLNLDYVPGMKDLYDILTDRGYLITTPNHTSLDDVKAMLDIFEILRNL